MVSIFLSLSLPVVVLQVEDLTPLLSCDVIALLTLLPLSPFGNVAIPVLLSVVVPSIVILLLIMLPVLFPQLPELIPTLFKAYALFHLNVNLVAVI
jgi:hypothetical protein